jgi:FkbM family methyltransferase
MGLKRITLHLHHLLRCVESDDAPVIVVDVGAGIHNIAPEWAYTTERLHPDDSDALWLLSRFGSRAAVHAFEMSELAVEQLRRAAATRNMTRHLAHHLVIHHAGVGRRQHQLRIATCGPRNRWALASSAGAARDQGYSCGRGDLVNVTSLDAFSARLGGISPLYIKVDVEGGEWDVLDGMAELLSSQRTELMSFEYATGWDRAFKRPVMHSIDEWRRRVPHTLFAFQERLSGWGYDTYLINAPRSGRISLVPLTGRFWQDELEICYNRTRYYRQHCWNDLIVVRRRSTCVRRVLFETILPLASSAATRNRPAAFVGDCGPECVA